jgi:hypothetical protein
MAVTILFNAMKALSRFRLWRIDARREKLEAQLQELAGGYLAAMRTLPTPPVLAATIARGAAERIEADLAALRARCRRQVGSMVTPMGEEMFYRYQEFRIEEALQTAAMLMGRAGAAVQSDARSAG